MPGASKKSSHEASEGTITRRLPSRNTVTDLTLSGKATSFDSLTAWDLLDWKSVVLLKTASGIYQLYIPSDRGARTQSFGLAVFYIITNMV